MLPLRTLGILIVMVLLYDADSACTTDDNPLTLDPPEIIGAYGESVTVNCSSNDLYHDGMYWTHGNKSGDEETFILMDLSLSDWNVKPECRIKLDAFECSKDLEITIYKTPDIVSVSAKDHDSMVEGREFQLNCDIINVAPVQKLKVKWYRGNETMHTETFNGTSVTPVNVTSSFVVTPKRDYNGTLFRCEAELHLGPHGPERIPTESSSPYTAVVLYKPLIQACPDRYTGMEDHFSIDMFPCDADGNPPPTVQWYYQGNQIDASETLNRTHSGNYTAKFVNNIGSSETSVNITIEYAPSFTCNDHYEVQEDDEPQTMCEPKGLPRPIITWFKDGTEMPPRQRWTKSDSGQYLLRATNKHGTANHSLHLDVLYEPLIQTCPDRYTGKEDHFSMNMLPCDADGNPPPTLQWSYQGNPIDAFEPLNRTHSGKYTAEFVNSIGSSETSVNITIEYAPSFTCNDHYEVQEDDEPLTVCEPKGLPRPIITWFKNGTEVPPPQRWTKSDSGQYLLRATNKHGTANHSLHLDVLYAPEFKNNTHFENVSVFEGQTDQTDCPLILTPSKVVVRFGDQASINCSTSATDAFGMGWEAVVGGTGFRNATAVTWTVEKLKEWTIKPDCYITINDGQCTVTPTITLYKTPDIVSVSAKDHDSMVEGREFQLNCDIINVAPVQKLKVKWYRGNETMHTETFNGTSVTPVNVTSSFVVTPKRDYNGTLFRCEAELHLGPHGPERIPTESSSPYTAVVLYKPLIQACPDRYTGMEDHFSIDMFPCDADGNPPPTVQWYYQGNQIDASEPLNRTHSGKYTAKFVNNIGSSETSIDITIEYAPSFTCNDHYEVQEDDEPQTMCEPKGVPKPIITWFKNGTEMPPPQRWTKSDSGQYLLRATNKHGTAHHSLRLDVLYEPLIQTCPDRYTGMEGLFSMNMLPCEADGNPPPTLQWSYQGNPIDAFEPLNRTHSGNYTAKFVNNIGSSETSVNITVEYAPSFTCNDHYEVQEDDEPQTVCEPKGVPKPIITWFKDGTEVPPPQRWTKSDSGQYLLRATNKHGTANHSLRLDVLYAPVFKQENNTVMMTLGENVTFDCHAVGNPPPVIRWNYSSADNVRETTWGRRRNITVKGATSTNAAVYICVATNKVGSVTRSVTLIMKGETSIAHVWWWKIPLIILLLLLFLFILVVIYRRCNNKHGKYDFVRVADSDIPLTTKS